jgi:hypothetical protein
MSAFSSFVSVGMVIGCFHLQSVNGMDHGGG